MLGVLDAGGRIHPYPNPLLLPDRAGGPATKCPVERIAGPIGTKPLPVSLVLLTQYQPGRHWRPRALSPGHALLGLGELPAALMRLPLPHRAVTGTTLLNSRRQA